jgi:gas vesicle protein
MVFTHLKEQPMAPLLLVGAAFGGAAMYLFDPDRGRRRRALIRDQAVKAQTTAREIVEDGRKDVANRATALTQRAGSLFRRRASTDDTVAQRVRSKMGRYVAHPGAVEVSASAGRVTLSGSILSHEHSELVEAIRKVRGVTDVDDQLSVFERSEGISALQGSGRVRGERLDFTQTHWSPAARMAGAGAGALLAVMALRGGVRGMLYGALGTLLLIRTGRNEPLSRMFSKAERSESADPRDLIGDERGLAESKTAETTT